MDLRGDVPERDLFASLDYPAISLLMWRHVEGAGRTLAPYRRELEAVIGARYKLIRASDGTELIFDLVADPDERAPLAAETVPADALARLRAGLDAPRAPARAAEPLTPSDEALEALRVLGYAAPEPE